MPAPGDRPDYKVYRARPRGLLSRLRGDEDSWNGAAPDGGGDRPGRAGPRLGRGDITPRRVLKWLAVAVLAWVLISAVLFLISAQLESGRISDGAKASLSGGFPAVSKQTVLVLGSDQRPKGSKEGNAFASPPRADTIMLMRAGGGASARLSVPRDTVVSIPGHGQQKINAAYAFGGTALMTKTVKQFLGVAIDHVVEVDFTNFPKFIDALGGVNITTGCVIADINGGTKNGGVSLRLHRGTHHLNGRQALALSRIRENRCNPAENDLTRARRQQKILNAVKDRMTSLHTFFHLPWVSWQAPKVIRTDMGGFTMLGLAAALGVGGNATPHVLKPTGIATLPDGGAGLTID